MTCARSASDMNPFTQLIAMAERPEAAATAPCRPVVEAAPRRCPAGTGSKLSQLLASLEEGPASTQALAGMMGLDTRAVWGLLKAPRERGQVRFDGAMWLLLDAYDDELRRELQAAAALLQRYGWTVQNPRSAA